MSILDSMKLYREVPTSRNPKSKHYFAEGLGFIEPIEITNIIEEVEDMRPYKQLGNRDSYSEYNEGWSDACDVILSKLKGE